MDFDSIVRRLTLPPEAESWRAGWRESQAAYGDRGKDFLSAAFVEDACAYANMGAEPAAALREGQALVERDRALDRLAWHCHYGLFRKPTADFPPPGQWPALPESLGPIRHTFYGLAMLSGLPHMKALHQARGIPDAATRETLDDIERWMRDYKKECGCWGFDKQAWLANHFAGRIVKLGRLQFEIRRFNFPFHAFRAKRDGAATFLAAAGQRFRRDGQFNGENGVFDEAGAWESTFSMDDRVVEGQPIHEEGRALRETTTLSLAEWMPILEPGAPSLGVHIPAASPLDPDACLDSFARAEAFFPKYFREHDFKAFETCSWLLDRQLTRYLPETSNIVRFLRMFRLLPAPHTSDAQTIERVFGRNVKDPLSEPAQTSLQQFLQQHMRDGGRFRQQVGVRFGKR